VIARKITDATKRLALSPPIDEIHRNGASATSHGTGLAHRLQLPVTF
jgi:hypothetical protein